MKLMEKHMDDVMFLLLAAAVFVGVAYLDGAEGSLPRTLLAVLKFVAEEAPHAQV